VLIKQLDDPFSAAANSETDIASSDNSTPVNTPPSSNS
jgi:hypothetical protein